MDNKVTLLDVASRAGVSRATASLVIRDTGRVSEATRERVRTAMHELGYVYHRGAASLRTQRASVIGVVVTNIANPYFGEVLGGLESELRAEGFATLLVNTNDDVSIQDDMLTMLREHQVTGLAMIPATGTDVSVLDRLTDWGLGHVLMSRYLDDGHGSYVGANDVRGGQLAGGHLLDHGCEVLAYVGGQPNILSRRDRMLGVRRALEERGLPETVLTDLAGEVSGKGGLALGHELLRRGRLPDGIVCHSDSVAFGLYRAFHDAGVTEEVRVTGYDDVAAAALWEPPLTSVGTHGRRLGEKAGQVLLRQIVNPEAEAEVLRLEPTLVIRQSCGCPRKS